MSVFVCECSRMDYKSKLCCEIEYMRHPTVVLLVTANRINKEAIRQIPDNDLSLTNNILNGNRPSLRNENI